MASGVIKADLRLPLGLANTALHVGGRLAPAWTAMTRRRYRN